MRIESLGLPGAGKTTLERACQAHLAEQGLISLDPAALDALDKEHPQGHRRIWRNDKLRQSFHIASYLSQHTNMHGFFATHYAQNPRNLALSLAVGADISRHEIQRDRLHSFWVGEGLLHLGSVALLESTGWKMPGALPLIDDLLAALPAPDVVVYLQAEPDLATEALLSRMAGFGHSPDSARGRFEQFFGGDAGMATRREVLDRLADGLEAAGVCVLRLQAHGALPTMMETVLGRLPDAKPGAAQTR